MRVLGVDYGRARIGLALSDPTGLFAQGLSVLQRESDSQAVADIVEVIQQYGVEEVVVGLPKNMNGTVGERAEQCAAFAEQLERAAGIPVRLFDERLTTVAAERLLIAADMRRKRRKQVVDEVAATLLLQSYLDWKQNQ
jgi:putative Holliday junction resolvase